MRNCLSTAHWTTNTWSSGDYRGEVANLSRNVVVESADPEGVAGPHHVPSRLGRIDQLCRVPPLGKEDVLGRYSLHFHLVGDTMRGSSVVGASIWDSGNRWLTIHGTNYLVVRDCVGYRRSGHGFFLEDGTEVYNVLDRNLAVQAHDRQAAAEAGAAVRPERWRRLLVGQQPQHLHPQRRVRERALRLSFDATQDQAASTSRLPIHAARRYAKQVDIRTLPFVRFEDNETHSDGLVRLQSGRGRGQARPRRPASIRRPQHEDLGEHTTPFALSRPVCWSRT